MVTTGPVPDPLNIAELIRQAKAQPPFRLRRERDEPPADFKTKAWQKIMEERRVKPRGWQ